MLIRYAFVIICCVFKLVLSCGMNTHIEISKRALYFFKSNSQKDYKQLINDNKDYFVAGSPFPDWGYACGFSNAAETTHWPPFIHEFLNYVKTTYQGNEARQNQLLSFLFGIESHGISDVIWHYGDSIPGTDEQGYLHSMGHSASNCNDNWQQCHSTGDNGADFYLAKRGLSWLSDTWIVPTNDLNKIYHNIGLNSDEWKMTECVFMMYAGAKLEAIGSILALANFEGNSAFLTENVDLYINGGLDDMAINVSWQWQNLINLIEEKTDSYVDNHKRFEFYKNTIINTGFKNSIKNILNGNNYGKYIEMLGIDNNLSNYGDRIVTINSNKANSNKFELISMLGTEIYPASFHKFYEFIPKYYDFKSTDSTENVKSNMPYSYFGKAVAINHYIYNTQYFIGAPGYGSHRGAVYKVNDLNFKELNFTEPFLTGEDEYSRFGFALTTADLNHDGIDDLIVSAPSYGINGPTENIEDYYIKTYYGKIYIYYGKPSGIEKDAKPDAIILSEHKSNFDNFGYFLNSGDCDGDGFKDLLIGSQFSAQGGDKRGSAAIFTNFNSTKTEVFMEEADMLISGQQNHEELGSFLTCNGNITLISATGYRFKSIDAQASGAVYGYNYKEKKLLFSILSDTPEAQFGSYIDLIKTQNKTLIGISAPTYSTKVVDYLNFFQGAVFIYNLENLLKFNMPKFRFLSDDVMSYSINDYALRIDGQMTRARFGKTLKFTKDNKLWISSAMFSSNLDIIENGAIFTFNNIDSLSGQLTADQNDGRLLNMENGSRFGDNIVIVEDQSKYTLIVSAPYTVESQMSGMLYLYNSDKFKQ